MTKEKLIKYGLKEGNLFAAILNQNTWKAIELIAQGGINLNACNTQGKTPLHCAVIAGEQKVVQALIEAGANLDIRDNKGETPLQYAYTHNNKSIIDLLVERHIALLTAQWIEKIKEGGSNANKSPLGGEPSPLPTHPVHNKESKWATLENFFSTLVSALFVKVLGLYMPGVPTGLPTEKQAYLVSRNQNKQKWWESQGGHSWVTKSDQLTFDIKLYSLPQCEYNKNNSFALLDSETIDTPLGESMLSLHENENITQELMT